MGTFSKIWKAAAVVGGAGLAALAAANTVVKRKNVETDDSVLGGSTQFYQWLDGRVFYKVAGTENKGAPVVFIHNVGVGHSSFTWRKNFDELSKTYCVYAPDLLGFGFSDKPSNASYSADLYVELIQDFLHDVVGQSAHVIAISLGAAYAIRVASMSPELIRSLVLVSPTGAGILSNRPGMTGAAFYGLLQSPVLGTSFYNALASERSIRDFAKQQYFYDRHRVTDRFVNYHYATSHQPGAQYAISAFLSGFLNTDARESFTNLKQPVTLVWGKQDETNPIEKAAELLQLNPQARLEIFDRCRMSPPEEHHERFNSLIRKIVLARFAAA
jgi:pimeloyl-ACP methyl ester carboxylesterase